MLSTPTPNGIFQTLFANFKLNVFLPIIIHFKNQFLHFENCQHLPQPKTYPHPLNRGNVNHERRNKVKPKFLFYYHYEVLRTVIHNGQTALRPHTVKDTVSIRATDETTARLMLQAGLVETVSAHNNYILIKDIRVISDKDGD